MSNNIIDNADSFDFENPSKKGPNGDQLKDVLEEAGVVMTINPSQFSGDDYIVAKKFTNSDGSINEELVYSELATLIAEGSQIVKQLRFADINAEGTLSGMASVLASVRQMIADFSKIHDSMLKHKQKMDLEKFKEESKMRLLERKYELDMKKLAATNKDDVDEQQEGKIGYSQTDLIKSLSEAKKQIELETSEIDDK